MQEPLERPFRAVLAMDPRWRSDLFGPNDADLGTLVRAPMPVWTHDQCPSDEVLAETEVLISGWGAPFIGAAQLDRMPSLRAVLHAAGSVKGHLSPEVWVRGVRVTSAAEANARPVAEYALAMILLAGKRVLAATDAYRQGAVVDPAGWPWIGNRGRRIGVVGASRTGRALIELLATFEVDVLVADPLANLSGISNPKASAATLAEVFAESDIISLHAPLLPETVGMVSRALLASMRPGSTLINSARGALIDEAALVETLSMGQIFAVLDVTIQEPLPANSPLRALPNVLITPHVAGAQGSELGRLGAAVVEELRRLGDGRAPAYGVSAASLGSVA